MTSRSGLRNASFVRPFARRIARAAGLRNRLVHDYEEIDHEKVCAALIEALADVSQHVEQVNAFLRERPHP
jgi:uncharacterized protein YutE (UPF0331/DUF86 family)